MRFNLLCARIVILLLLLFPLTGCLSTSSREVQTIPSPTRTEAAQVPIVLTATSSRASTTRPSRTPDATRTQQPVRTITPTATPSQIFIQTATPSPVIPLSATEPWLVYSTYSDESLDIIALNKDGTGRTILDTLQRPIGFEFSRSRASPWFAVSYQESAGDFLLSLYHLPTAKPVRTISLLAKDLPDSPPFDWEPGARRMVYEEILHRFGSSSLQAWSPGGRYFAFIGAVDGPSLDLYVYDTQANDLRRLTTGSREAIYPAWSPYGNWIILQEFEGRFSEMGFTNSTAIYAIRPDGSETKLLYEPKPPSQQNILGWTSADTFAVLSYTEVEYGEGYLEILPHDARLFNINSYQIVSIYSDYFEFGAFDPNSGVFAFTFTADFEAIANRPSGLYLKYPGGGAVRVYDAVYDPRWEPRLRQFVWHGEDGIFGMTPAGEVTLYSDEQVLFGAPNGQWQVALGEIMGIQDLIWRPDSAGLFYTTTFGLFYLATPESQPILVDMMSSFDFDWVGAGTDQPTP